MKKKKFIIFIIVTILIVLFGVCYYLYNENIEKQEKERLLKEQELIAQINSHYHEYVKTNKETSLYNVDEKLIGKIGLNVELSLEKLSINKDTKYFKIKDFENTYIKYNDVDIIDNLSEIDSRYKQYIVFNENIVTNDKTGFYDEKDNLLYEFNISFDLPIIIKEENKYGVEFNNRLLYVKNEDVKETKNNNNTDKNNSSGVAVLNYHAFYDENSQTERRNCATTICHSKSQFKSHLDYIQENNILTLKMNEFEMYIDGKIQLPKSVLITIDDGGRTHHAIQMLDEYKMYATIFLVTSWFDTKDFYQTEYLEYHSHSHNLHNQGDCPTGQGGGIQCLNREILLNDLKLSREELNNTTAFCYPFYEFNNYSISILKEAGFTMGFAGQYGDALAKVGVDKFRIPRYVISTSTTLKGFDNYFKRIKD